MDKDLERRETVFSVCFFSCLDHPFLLGLAIIPRKVHFENHSSQIIFILQSALLGTVLPEWKGI